MVCLLALALPHTPALRAAASHRLMQVGPGLGGWARRQWGVTESAPRRMALRASWLLSGDNKRARPCASVAAHASHGPQPMADSHGLFFNSRKLAVLIDGENAQAAVLDALLAEVSKYGTASVKRIYADWTIDQSRAWKSKLLAHAVQPMQQFGYTTGKNSSDSALIIDAMDLLHGGTVDGFCLVSSDSDFTRLASRLREGGHLVLGFGERKTPKAFVASCDKFVFTEVLRPSVETEAPDTEAPGTEAKPSDNRLRSSSAELQVNKKLINALVGAHESCANEEGWAYLSDVHRLVCSSWPAFDSRNFGYKKLSELFEATGCFKLRVVRGSGCTVFLKDESQSHPRCLQPEKQD